MQKRPARHLRCFLNFSQQGSNCICSLTVMQGNWIKQQSRYALTMLIHTQVGTVYNTVSMKMAVKGQDLHAQLRSSPAAALHGFGGPFASSPEGQSLHVPPLRATPDSLQSFHSSTGWPALDLCLGPCMLLAPAPRINTTFWCVALLG